MKLADVEALLSSTGMAELAKIENEEVDLSSFLLSRDGVISKELLRGLAEQIKSRKLLRKKHPSLFGMGVLCEKSLLEQSTAEEVARYRASLFSGTSCIDCTGGMGVDLMRLMERFQQGVYCELDEGRAALFSYNMKRLGTASIDVVVGDSVAFIQKCGKAFDLLFIDPARRDEGERFFSLERSMPNIIEHWGLLLRTAKQVVVKLSPMIDIPKVLAELRNLQRVEVVSLDGEVKEVMLVASLEAVGEICYKATLLRSGVGAVASIAGKRVVIPGGGIGQYLYDCDAAVVKAGLVGVVAKQYSLTQVHMVNQLLSSDDFVDAFPGRSFRVLSVQQWQRKACKKYLKNCSLTQAVVVSRGFPLSVQELRKQFSLGESDSVFLFFTQNELGKKVVIHCERVCG